MIESRSDAGATAAEEHPPELPLGARAPGTRRPRRLPESDDIDRLYGLEPVFERGATDALAATGFVAVQCPYCGERVRSASQGRHLNPA
jgi:hypothetical protein